MQVIFWHSSSWVCFGRGDETDTQRQRERERERERRREVWQRWRLSWLLLVRFLRHWRCSLLLPPLLALLAFLPHLVPYPELEFLLLLRLLLLLLSRCVRLAFFLSFSFGLSICWIGRKKIVCCELRFSVFDFKDYRFMPSVCVWCKCFLLLLLLLLLLSVMVLLVMDMLAFLSSFFSVDWLYGVMLMLRSSFSSGFF